MSANPNPPAADPQPQPAPPAGAPNTETQVAEHMIPKSRLDDVLRERDTLRQEKTEREKAEQKAAAKRAEELGEWEKLAKQHETRAAELEPFKAKAERYETALKALLETQRKDLPSHILGLLDKLDAAEQLEWIAANREHLAPAATNGSTTTARTTTTPAPKPAGTPSLSDQVKERIEQLKSTGMYGHVG